MTNYVLDTNAISAVVEKKGRVKDKLQEEIFRGNGAYISGLTYYEVKRGLLAEDLLDEIAEFDAICRMLGVTVILIDSLSVLDGAATIWADLRKAGTALDANADILIAASAIAKRMVVVTADSHFDTIRGVTQLAVENWL